MVGAGRRSLHSTWIHSQGNNLDDDVLNIRNTFGAGNLYKARSLMPSKIMIRKKLMIRLIFAKKNLLGGNLIH